MKNMNNIAIIEVIISINPIFLSSFGFFEILIKTLGLKNKIRPSSKTKIPRVSIIIESVSILFIDKRLFKSNEFYFL